MPWHFNRYIVCLILYGKKCWQIEQDDFNNSILEGKQTQNIGLFRLWTWVMLWLNWAFELTLNFIILFNRNDVLLLLF